MALLIKSSRPADPATWDRLWDACRYATYFHSRQWAELWHEYSNGRIHAVALDIEFSDGARAILPLSYAGRRASFLGHYLASPAGTFGGWLSTDALSPRHKALLATHLLALRRNVVWRVNPYDEFDVASVPARVVYDETQAVHLADGIEAVTKRLTKSHRRSVSKARREGVTVSLGATRADWLAFSEIYANSVERWGDRATSVYSQRLFEIFAQRNSPNVRLWLAHYDGVAVAGALCVYARHHVAYWLGAALASYFPVRPVHLLLYEAIESACRNGYEWFDFNPNGGHEGVAAFKNGFGPIRLPAPVVLGQTTTSRALTAARRTLRPLRSLHL